MGEFDHSGNDNVSGRAMKAWDGLSAQTKLTCRMTRFLSLLYFSQCLFLVFSAVYIAKESLEQVVLGGHEHGGQSHGHADHDEDGWASSLSLLCTDDWCSAGS